MQTRICTKCNKEKSLDCFHKHDRGKYGHVAKCVSCSKEVNKNRYHKDPKVKERAVKARQKRLAWLKEYKESRGCCVCGNNLGCVLDFHHIRDKKFNISENYGKAFDVFLKEIEKCVVVCANHHRMIHAGLIDIDRSITN